MALVCLQMFYLHFHSPIILLTLYVFLQRTRFHFPLISAYVVMFLLDLCVSSLRRGHANLLCVVPTLTDDPRRESNVLMFLGPPDHPLTARPLVCLWPMLCAQRCMYTYARTSIRTDGQIDGRTSGRTDRPARIRMCTRLHNTCYMCALSDTHVQMYKRRSIYATVRVHIHVHMGSQINTYSNTCTYTVYGDTHVQ